MREHNAIQAKPADRQEDSELANFSPSWEKTVEVRQAPITEVLPELVPELERHPGFAGVFVEAYVLVINTAGDPDAAADIARGWLQPSQFKVRSVEYTLTELRALHEQLNADAAEWMSKGFEFGSWGVNQISNRLEISVVDLTDAERQELERIYGPRVSVVSGERWSTR